MFLPRLEGTTCDVSEMVKKHTRWNQIAKTSLLEFHELISHLTSTGKTSCWSIECMDRWPRASRRILKVAELRTMLVASQPFLLVLTCFSTSCKVLDTRVHGRVDCSASAFSFYLNRCCSRGIPSFKTIVFSYTQAIYSTTNPNF